MVGLEFRPGSLAPEDNLLTISLCCVLNELGPTNCIVLCLNKLVTPLIKLIALISILIHLKQNPPLWKDGSFLFRTPFSWVLGDASYLMIHSLLHFEIYFSLCKSTTHVSEVFRFCAKIYEVI